MLNNDSSLTVSLTGAKRILGATAKGLSDDQVGELLITLTLLARQQLVYNGSKNEQNLR